MFKVGAEVIFNHIEMVVKNVDGRAVDLVDQMAERIKRGGEQRARRDSGEMADSFEIRGSGKQREVVNTSEHFVYNEYGTRKMAAKPMLTPAATDEQLSMEGNAQKAFGEVL